jgi:hypothetical protein
MPTPTNLQAILQRIAAGKQTDADFSALRDSIVVSGTSNVVQVGKYNINIKGKRIRVGNLVFQEADADAIKDAVRKVLEEAVPPPPKPTSPPTITEFLILTDSVGRLRKWQVQPVLRHFSSQSLGNSVRFLSTARGILL